MSDELKIYKCPCCNAGLKYAPGGNELVCEYCDSKYTIEQIKEIYPDEEVKEEENDWGNYKEETMEGFTEFVCQSCGAHITGDENTAATECVYCGNPVILYKRLDGLLKPDFVIPFKLDKEGAKKSLDNFYQKKILLSKKFKLNNKVENIKTIYVPFWLYDCDSYGDVNFNGEIIHTWVSGDYRYKKTDHYLLRRRGGMGFEKIPADGSKNMDDSYMDTIEPFDYSGLMDFNTAYLSGYLADKYDVTAKECQPRINTKVRNAMIEEFRRTTHGYTNISVRDTNISIKNGTIKYALLPVYILNTTYKDKKYMYAVNGQTGKVAGKLPISGIRAALLGLVSFAGIELLLNLIMLIAGLL